MDIGNLLDPRYVHDPLYRIVHAVQDDARIRGGLGRGDDHLDPTGVDESELPHVDGQGCAGSQHRFERSRQRLLVRHVELAVEDEPVTVGRDREGHVWCSLLAEGHERSTGRRLPRGREAYWPFGLGTLAVMGLAPDPPRSRSKELRAGHRTAAEARLFLSEALESFGVEVDEDAAALMTSEIASNAIRHGKEPINVSISAEERGLRVSVLDRGSGFDAEELRFDQSLEIEGGRGLRIVHALSSDWGVERSEDATEVWFRL